MVYGINVFLIGLLNVIIFQYALYSKDIDTAEVTSRLIKQARIRLIITPLFALAGIVVANYSTDLAFALFALPIIFNVLPGTLNALEKLFGFELK